MPSSSAARSFGTFHSSKMGFGTAPTVPLPSKARLVLDEWRPHAFAYFGDPANNFELDRMKFWTFGAAAGAREVSDRVPTPLLTVNDF